ncbi:restriction endonuclease subunit R [cf. Phormidesmis sp. LEGE 11477]|uniref:restriction endonuclease subunit R n=1 Tax=cf. Phormidesmis sp. LEGE 11477 TaxID=1828680 RepID=UPI00187FDC9B|nr:restriction endonuclease subunit R [cf. Phormidesmis sp. LEGE 11477]MBE9063132.1 restriction endonuclease subunit R [cf. Phormidesmis sp. LEGE 11477]
MSRAVGIEKLTVLTLKQQTGLKRSGDHRFFFEWQTSLPELNNFEKTRAAHVKAIYENFEDRSALENTVSLTVVSPLLDTVGLFLPPFYVETEKSVEIIAEDDELTLRGRLDIVIIKDSLWVLTIESKRAGFSPIVGIPQVLAYMLAASTAQKTLYGMVTNGRHFIFLKLDRQASNEPVYEQSKEFIIDRDNDLELTLRVIKQIADVISR